MDRYIVAGVVAGMQTILCALTGIIAGNHVYWLAGAILAAEAWTWISGRRRSLRGFMGVSLGALALVFAWAADVQGMPSLVRATLVCLAIGIFSAPVARAALWIWGSSRPPHGTKP